MTRDLYAEVTDTILAALEQGVVPWQQPWIDSGFPKSLATGKPYHGVNAFLLALQGSAKGYSTSYWTTFNQAKQRGGSVRKGEKGTLVIFWKRIVTEDKDSGEKKVIPLLKSFTVFNLDQCDGLEKVPADAYETRTAPDPGERHEAAQKVLADYINRGPRFREDSCDGCYYVPSTDSIHVPPRANFTDLDSFFASAFHEAGHSTGHGDRLARTHNTAFGSHEYGREELIAEMTAAFVSAECGIVTQYNNHAAYLESWRKTINEDRRAVVVAAGAAQKAANLIFGRVEEPADE